MATRNDVSRLMQSKLQLNQRITDALLMFVSEEIVHVAVATSIGRPLLFMCVPRLTRHPRHHFEALVAFTDPTRSSLQSATLAKFGPTNKCLPPKPSFNSRRISPPLAPPLPILSGHSPRPLCHPLDSTAWLRTICPLSPTKC